jgi:hypothetical protein
MGVQAAVASGLGVSLLLPMRCFQNISSFWRVTGWTTSRYLSKAKFLGRFLADSIVQ